MMSDRGERNAASSEMHGLRRAGLGLARWKWAALFVIPYFLLGLAWVGSNPPGASPDESDHLVKALGAGRLEIGQAFHGEPDDYGPALAAIARRNASIARVVNVPARLAPDGYGCTAFQPQLPATCLPPVTLRTPELVERRTNVGAYPPFEYVPIGVAARATGSPYHAFLAGRVVVLCASSLLLLLGAQHLVRWLGRWSLIGVSVAITPMVVFATGSLSTSGVEIIAALAVGAAVSVCVLRPEAIGAASTQTLLAIAGTALILSRQMGVVTFVALMLVLIASVGFPRIWVLLRRPRPVFVASTAALLAAGAAVSYWELNYDHPSDTAGPFSVAAWARFWDIGFDIVRSGIGVFGWLDSPLPRWAVGAWICIVLVACGMALLLGSMKHRVILASMLVATTLVGYATYASVFYPIQAGIQGRHLLPLFVFCPLFASIVAVDRLRRLDMRPTLQRIYVGVGVTAGLINLMGLYWNARRYAVGSNGPVVFFADSLWAPGLGWWPWLAVGAGGSVLLSLVVIRCISDAADLTGLDTPGAWRPSTPQRALT